MNLPGCFLATYKLQPHYEYSERHALYVEEVKKVEGLPPPHPPHTSKEEIFNIKQYRDVDRRADKVSHAGTKYSNNNSGYLCLFVCLPACLSVCLPVTVWCVCVCVCVDVCVPV